MVCCFIRLLLVVKLVSRSTRFE